MADDPERDIIPVKEGASCEKQRYGSNFSLSGEKDKLHAPHVAKLDRKELEDRFMCLMLDNNNLKKECSKQEEKIKRLATKLLRLVAEQKRDLPTAAQRHDHNLECLVVEQQQQIRELQQSNSQLQDRVAVLRNQLVEHASVHSAVHCNLMGKSRSPSRAHARPHTKTCVTSSTRQNVVSLHTSQKNSKPEEVLPVPTKTYVAFSMFQPNLQTSTPHCGNQDTPHPIGTETVEDHQRLNNEQRTPEVPNSKAALTQQNQKLSEEIMRLHEQISILEQGLETLRERSSVRIVELEDELANTVAENQQQKVAENIEMIRLQRSLQQRSAQLAAESAQNQVLQQDLAHLRQELETVQQDNDELHHQLTNERQKVVDLQQQLQGLGSNCLSVRELQEQIRDIQNERSTLKEHNERLLALISSRQIQGSEQEVALHLQVSQLESTLAKERSERAELMQRIDQLEAHDEARLQQFAEQEKALCVQVMQLEAALAAERKERSSLLETVNGMHQNMYEPNNPLVSDQDGVLHVQVTQLETKLAKALSDRTQILNSLEEERTQVAALKVAHSDLLVKLQDLQAQHTKIEGQLQTLQQDSRRGVSFHIPPPAPSALSAWSPPRIPTLEQSQRAQRLTFKSEKICQMSSSSSFTEDFLICPDKMNYRRLKDLDTVNEIESILDISCNSQTSQTSYSEVKSSASPVTNTGFEELTKASNQEKSLQRKTDSCCICGKVPRLLNGASCACLRLSSLSLIPSHGHEDSVHVTDEQESSDLHVIDDTSKAITEKISFSSQSDHIALPHDSQLLENEREKSKSVPEEGSQASDDSVMFKIANHDSWQNNEVNLLDAHLGEDWVTAANQLDINRELEKCRELLRVQYNLNSVYKKEVTSLAKQLKHSEDEHAKKMDKMNSLLQKQTAHISNLQDQLETSVLDRTVHHTGHLTIDVGEGLFIIHVNCLHLSSEGLGSIMKEACDPTYKKRELPNLFLTWVFYDQDVSYTPVKAAKTSTEFNSSSVYRVIVNDEFLEYLEEEDFIIDIHMAVDDASEAVARGTAHFSEVFRFPQKKIHITVPLVGTGTQEAIVGFGVIECWFQLCCAVGLLSSYMQHRTANKVTTKIPVPAPRQKKEQISPEISSVVSSKTPDNIITEVQVQLEEDEDATKDESEEKMPVQGSTAEESPTEYRLPEKDNEKGNVAEDSA